MGCFLGCLGSSKAKKGKRLQPNTVPSGARVQRGGYYNAVEQVVSLDESLKLAQLVALPDEAVKPMEQPASLDERKSDSLSRLALVLQSKASDEVSGDGESNALAQQEASPKMSNLAPPCNLGSREKSSSGAKKKVSFNSVVKTIEPIPTCELLEKKTEAVAKLSKSTSLTEVGSNALSLGSYPPNHRYQNCRESDDEEEELDYEESDIDAGDADDDEVEEDEFSDGDVSTDSFSSMTSTTGVSPGGKISLEVNRHDKPSERNPFDLISRGRDGFDRSVLNPVENLSQWKALKGKGKPPLQLYQKEDSVLDFKELPVISFSHAHNFNQGSRVKSKVGCPERQTQRMAVDASLSNWLTSPEPINKSKVVLQNVTPQKAASHGLYSLKSLDDRPILGALTVEELKIMSRTSSPRKSPSKSPDDMAIIGSVGSYWSHEDSKHGSASISTSNKGIPNTNSKYGEHMTVNWDSTPFETRLENALNQVA